MGYHSKFEEELNRHLCQEEREREQPEEIITISRERRAGVYIARDREGRVAYVGASGNVLARIHGSAHEGLRAGDEIEVWFFAHEEVALQVERRLIRELKPYRNRPGSTRTLEQELPLLGHAALAELLNAIRGFKAEISRAKQRGRRGF